MMNSDLNLESNRSTVYQLLEELQTQFLVLEEQVKLGPCSDQTETDSAETVTEEFPLVLEDDFSTD